MRSLGNAVAAVGSVACFALAVPACGGDDALPPASPDAGADAPTSTIDDRAPTPKPVGDGGGYVPIDVDCPIGTAVEIEPNDTAAQATELDGMLSMCGSITPGADVDYSTFTTPTGKRLAFFQAVIDGKVDFDLVVNEKTLRPGDVKKFEAGTYVVKAYTTDKEPGKYRYRVQFEP